MEEELQEMGAVEKLEPMEITFSEEVGLDSGLAIFTPESCATPMKVVCIWSHDMWEKALPNNILKENFGPTHCSTPRTIFKTGVFVMGAPPQ